jgi:adenylylsulfate kinase
MRDSHPADPEIGAIVWFTGVPRAGKTTLARAVAGAASAGRRVEILDGDAVRAALSPELGFSRPDRDAHVGRLGFLARVLAKHGVVALVAAIAPYADARDEVRRLAGGAGLAFVEVFVTAPLETLIQRDTSGLYARALAGEIPHFTGVSAPYEPPSHAELIVHSDVESVEASARRVVECLARCGVRL